MGARTLGDLMKDYDSAAGAARGEDKTAAAASAGVGHNKTASAEEGAHSMGRTQSLQDIYLTMTDMDKTAGQGGSQSASADDLAVAEQVAEQIAAAEAAELESGYDKTASADDEGGLADNEFVKQAAELDAAGRIMARGLWDELTTKLAGDENMVVLPRSEFEQLMKAAAAGGAVYDAPNTRQIPVSRAKTPALGERRLPHVPTDYSGAPQGSDPSHLPTTGAANGKDVYRDSLKPSKTVSAGMTGDDPEAAAIALGGGSPAGFATVRHLFK